jgi:alcohol dehydrogenase class IV
MVEGVYERWHQWARVAYGDGCAQTLDRELARLGVRSALLLTTRSVAAAGLAERVRAAAASRIAAVETSCVAHVPQDTVAALAVAATSARADALVAVGGGSAIDSAKATALALSPDPEQPALPIVALPTTLSGAEFTGIVATTDANAVKHLHADDRLAPASVLLDPQLALATPQRLWLSTGVKTLSDAIEQVCADTGTPVTDTLCRGAIERFVQSLPASRAADPAARLQCQLAAWLALFGLYDGGASVGLGAALRHQVAVTCGVAHGDVTCVLLPHVLRFNGPALGDRAGRVAQALGLPEGRRTADAAADTIAAFVSGLGLPSRLSQLTDARPDMSALARRVAEEPAARRNPRRLGSAAEVEQLLEAAW